MKVHPLGPRTVAMTVLWLVVAAMMSQLRGIAARAQGAVASSFGPSVAGRLYALALDPERPNVIYAGGDVCGVYRSLDGGDSWQLWSQGLESQEHTSSMFVNDLLVVPSTLPGIMPGRAGVYAATLGGIYFRAFNDAHWTLMTNIAGPEGHPDMYMYGRLDQPRKGLSIPFCTLALDEHSGVLYAGAGNRVYQGRSSARDSIYNIWYSYPALANDYFNSGVGVGDQYTLWSLGVTTESTGPAAWSYDSSELRPRGLARQIAILSTDPSEPIQRHWVAIGTSKGIWIKDDVAETWQQIEDDTAKSIEAVVWSGFVWGVAAGTNGRLYALTRQFDDPSTEDPVLPAGVWYRDLVSSADGAWHFLGDPLVDVPPYDGQMESTHHDFQWFITGAAWCDLTTISVRPGPAWNTDEVYVGGYGSNRSGYFRYGNYESASGPARGWIQFQYARPRPPGSSPDDWANMQYFSIDWKHQPIERHDMYLPPVNKLGWLGNDGGINSNVAIQYDESMSHLVLDLYHRPLASPDSGRTWDQVYCDKGEFGWTGRGLNLDTTTDFEFDSSGRMLLSTLDFGVFEGDDDASAFRSWNRVHPWNPSFGEIAICSAEAGDEVYGIRNPDWTNSPEYQLLMHNPAPEVAGTAAEWDLVCGSGSGTQFTSIALCGRDKLFVTTANSGAAHGLLVLTRNASGKFANPQDPGAAVGANMYSIANVPGTTLMICGGNGQLTCFDAAAPSAAQVWLTGSGASAIGRAAKQIRRVWVDRLGRVAYVGTMGACNWNDSAPDGAIGAVLRFDGPFSAAAIPTPVMLANSGSADHPFGFAIPATGFPAHDDQPNERYTYARCFATDPNNPYRVYVGLGVPPVLYQGNMHTKNGVWFYDPEHVGSPGPWSQVFGGATSTSRGANRQVLALAHRPGDQELPGIETGKLFVGTDGQGPFWMPIDVTVPPSIAATAAYPVLADATGAENAIGVHVTPAASTTIDTVTVDLRPWGGGAYEPLRDNGVAPDLTARDGIYTSGLLSTDFGNPGTISVNVFAQASDGGYASQAVALQVIGNPVAENAAYRFRAGSTDTSYVFAVAVASPPSWRQVTANLTAVSGPADIELKDDGDGEDVKSGDGIFTSPRFAASMPNQGTYTASVTAEPTVGGAVTQVVNMSAIAVAAKFKNDSELNSATRLGDALATGLTARPYASVYFRARPNDNARESVMITTFDDNSTPPGIWGRIQDGGSEGQFVARGVGETGAWLEADLPAGSRGVCSADFDNDGDTDFFICSPLHGGKLFVNHLYDTSGPQDWQGKFVDQTADFFGVDAVYLDGAVAAAWGDYTGDGFVDLFVATANHVGPIDDVDDMECPTLGARMNDLCLFKNNMGVGFLKSLVWGTGAGSVCLAGCWVDFDNDGDLDLVTSRFVDGGLGVLENHGVNATHTDMDMVESIWSLAVEHRGINSIATMDYNNDALPDLIITDVAQSQRSASVLWTDTAHIGGKSFVEVPFGVGRAWTGAVVADFNLDGRDDFALLPRDADVVPALFMSNGYTVTPGFEDPDLVLPLSGGGATPLYRELGYTLGLRDGRTGGGFAADLDGDHAPDLFLGRNGADPFLYRSAPQTGETNHSLQVKLRTIGNSNGSLIGTKVEVAKGSKRWRKSVDGGSIRGGQSPNDLLFGLGSESSVDSVRVIFPSGEIDVRTSVADTVTIWENAMGSLSHANPRYTYELHPGRIDWVFRWRSASIKGDLRQDRVVVEPWAHPTNPCYDEFEPMPPLTLAWGGTDVTPSVYRDGTYWIHELRWSNVQCIGGCRWAVKFYSGAGAGGATTSLLTPAVTAPVSYCIPEFYGQ